LGNALQAQGKQEEAIAAFRQQVQVKPDHAYAWNGLGLALERQGKQEEAIAAYRQQVQVTPDHAYAWGNLGAILHAQGKQEEAIAALQRHVQVMPNHVEAWLVLGTVLWKQGSNEGAASAYAKGLALQPTNLSLLSSDMELALAQGDRSRLVRHAETAMPQVTPEDQFFAILPFFSWLANPIQDWGHVLRAIRELDPKVEFEWDFSDTARAITYLGLDASTQQIAQHFLDFFERRIDLQTLQTRLGAR
jgi:Flp pilus assembly protein TadD